MSNSRDHREAYRRRIAGGLARGLTLKEARGHGAPLAHVRERRQGLPFDPDLELALRKLRVPRASLSAAAREAGVSRERLSAYAKAVEGATYDGRRWSFTERRFRSFEIIEAGELDPVPIRVRGFEAAHLAGKHAQEAEEALRPFGDRAAFIRRWEGVRIRDVRGHWHELSTDFNQLFRAILTQDFSFEKFYSIDQ